METKPGWKTTEFWFTALAYLLAILVTSGAFGTESMIMKVALFAQAALASLGYAVGRGIAKSGNPLKLPE